MTYEVQQNRWDQLVRRVSGSIGGGSRVSETLSELFPVLDVERVPGELLWLGQNRICFGSTSFTGAAGEVPRIQLFNPVASGKIITVSALLVSVTAAASVRYTISSAALTTGVATQRFRDSRGGFVERPAGEIRTQSSVANTDATGHFRLNTTFPFYIVDENSAAVLAPGAGFEVGTNVVTGTLFATFNWRERDAEQSELI